MQYSLIPNMAARNQLNHKGRLGFSRLSRNGSNFNGFGLDGGT